MEHKSRMNGETDLKTLLASMRPWLHEQSYVFCTISQEAYKALPFQPLGSFHEQEGTTVIVTQSQASQHDLLFEGTWAHITLRVHSSLSAMGFLATITRRLAAAGISVNPVSAYYHDHLFVPWEKRSQAMDVLGKIPKER